MRFRHLVLVTIVAITVPTYQFFLMPKSHTASLFISKPISSPVSETHAIAELPKSYIQPIFDDSHQNFGSGSSQLGFDFNPLVLQSIESILNYANSKQIEHNQILTLIDYSLPANQKRLWVLDLNNHSILFHTYVSHGLKSGELDSSFFSNHFDSKASSIGVYRTNKTYYGRHGLSLKLDGLDPGFNDNADSRSIVMHGGWYVEEAFIQKYGRAGRSWGCPAIPDQLTSAIINTIKDKSLFVIYYPSPKWLEKSRFLNAKPKDAFTNLPENPQNKAGFAAEKHEDVLLAQIKNKHKYQETEAILALSAERYSQLFQSKIPLERMLRRQIEDREYIAVSESELEYLLSTYPHNLEAFQDLCFILPEIKKINGYYSTEMVKVKTGSIIDIEPANAASSRERRDYIFHFTTHPSIAAKTTHRFIRWLGL